MLLSLFTQEDVMNYQKLDAALVTSLNGVPESEVPGLSVFIHTEVNLDAAATNMLENFGVSAISNSYDVFTAMLSPKQISFLTEQSWVKMLRRSQQLCLINHKKY